MCILISRVITKRIIKYNCQANRGEKLNNNKYSMQNKQRKGRKRDIE